jgi:DNA-binding transcriptional LysR family regulator
MAALTLAPRMRQPPRPLSRDTKISGRTPTSEGLAGHHHLHAASRSFRRLFADVPEDPDVRHLVDDFATQLSLVASGEVFALIPRLARPPLAEGLASRPLRRQPKREVHAAWRRSAHASPAIRAVLAELGSAIRLEDALTENAGGSVIERGR